MEPTATPTRRNGQRKPYKTTDLIKRAKNCRRRVFTISEDKIIIKCVSSSKFNNDWEAVANLLSSRSARQVRDRWMYYLSPTNNLAPFSPEEDQLIIEKVNELGKKWSQISKFFSGRSDNSIKNRWYSKLVSKCDVSESGVYSLDPSKIIDQPEKKKSTATIKPQDSTDNLDKTEVSEPEFVYDQKAFQNQNYSIFSLKLPQQQENTTQSKNSYDFWDGDLIDWPNDIFNNNSNNNFHSEFTFF